MTKSESMRDILRSSVVEKSITILRNHGKSDNEIREMMLKDFSIEKEKLDKLLNIREK